MKKSGFLFFLIFALASTAFLAGYILVSNGLDPSSKSKTGTILAKFGGSGENTPNDQEIAEEEGGIVLLTPKQVNSVSNSLDKGSVLYFESLTGKIYELNLETKEERVVSDKILPNFVSAIWSPTKKEAIGYFSSGQETAFKNIDILTGKERVLDRGIFSIAFSPDGSLVAYHYLDTASSPSQGKIAISEADGGYSKKIINTRLESVVIGWPIREKLTLKTLSSEILLLTEDGKLESLLGPLSNLEESWSPSGNKLIYSHKEPEQEQAMLFIKEVASRKEYPLEVGEASKCVWSIDDLNVFCAISKSPSADEVYKINTTNASKTLIAEPEMKVKQLILTSGEDDLLLMSLSNNLYKFRLP